MQIFSNETSHSQLITVIEKHAILIATAGVGVGVGVGVGAGAGIQNKPLYIFPEARVPVELAGALEPALEFSPEHREWLFGFVARSGAGPGPPLTETEIEQILATDFVQCGAAAAAAAAAGAAAVVVPGFARYRLKVPLREVVDGRIFSELFATVTLGDWRLCDFRLTRYAIVGEKIPDPRFLFFRKVLPQFTKIPAVASESGEEAVELGLGLGLEVPIASYQASRQWRAPVTVQTADSEGDSCALELVEFALNLLPLDLAKNFRPELRVKGGEEARYGFVRNAVSLWSRSFLSRSYGLFKFTILGILEQSFCLVIEDDKLRFKPTVAVSSIDSRVFAVLRPAPGYEKKKLLDSLTFIFDNELVLRTLNRNLFKSSSCAGKHRGSLLLVRFHASLSF